MAVSYAVSPGSWKVERTGALDAISLGFVEMEGTVETNNASLVLSEVRETGALAAASLEGASLEVSAVGWGSAGGGTKYVKSASEEEYMWPL